MLRPYGKKIGGTAQKISVQMLRPYGKKIGGTAQKFLSRCFAPTP